MEKSARIIAPPFYALIVAAGSGTRLGSDIPKQYIEIEGKSILRHTLETVLSCPDLAGVRVVIDPAHEALYEATIRGLELPPPTYGGKDRKESVSNGLKSFSNLKDEDIILIHDAARPFAPPALFTAIADAVRENGAATAALPVADTLRRAGDGSYVDRAGLHAIQTPQGFTYGLIRRAHAEKADMVATDDTALVAVLGHDIRMVESTRGNFKITTADDLAEARRLLAEKKDASNMMETRTGSGFDVHAFDTAGDKKAVRLCGIDIPHAYGLAGHSDADVGLHALTDALLGAVAAGDIGQHFPPSDPQWKGADSSLFLKRAVDIVREKGGRIINLDLTLICEAPKIGPHSGAMQTRVAAICNIAPGRVGIKATTTEKLGFTGRREGIAAQALATVAMPLSAD